MKTKIRITHTVNEDHYFDSILDLLLFGREITKKAIEDNLRDELENYGIGNSFFSENQDATEELYEEAEKIFNQYY